MKCRRGTYLFLTNDITGVGGGQIYLAVKSEHLLVQGWDVEVWSYTGGKVVIPQLQKYEENVLPGLSHRYSTATAAMHSRVMDEICSHVDGERVVVESYSLDMAMWGEAIAQRLSERMQTAHLWYNLVENARSPGGKEREFALFKWSQGLFRGITSSSLHLMLPEIPDGEGGLYSLGVGEGNIRDVGFPSEWDVERNEDFVILSVGRLDKPYIQDMLTETAAFARRLESEGKSVRLIMVGDTRDTYRKRRLRETVAGIYGLNVEWWGEVWPMPRAIYDRADIFVGLSGAAEEAAAEGLPTVILDSNDHQVIGLLGETTHHELYRSADESPLPLREVMCDLFRQRELRRESRGSFRKEKQERDFTAHDHLADTARQRIFFDVSHIAPRDFKGKILKFINRMDGGKTVTLLKKLHR